MGRRSLGQEREQCQCPGLARRLCQSLPQARQRGLSVPERQPTPAEVEGDRRGDAGAPPGSVTIGLEALEQRRRLGPLSDLRQDQGEIEASLGLRS